MPAALVALLGTPRPPSPVHLRGWLYHLLTPRFPELHRGAGPRPFAIATGVSDGGGTWVRFAFLDDALAGATAGALWDRMGKPLPLGKKQARLLAVLEHAHPLAGEKPWPAILGAPPASDLALEFLTPTLFKKGDVHYPVPDPERILSSLIRHWNAFAPEKLTEDLTRALVKKVTARFLNVHTRAAYGHTRTPGFVGRIALHFPKAGETEGRWVARLGELAFFSGVGAKTTLGFGLARRLEKREEGADPNGRAHRGTHRREP